MNEYTFRSDPATDPASTDAYADIPITAVHPTERQTQLRAVTTGPISANIKNTGANSIDVRVLGSNDPNAAVGDWAVVLAEAAIAAAASLHYEEAIAYYAFYRFQQKATVGASQGAAHVFGRHGRV